MILTTNGHRRIPTLWRLLERNLSTQKKGRSHQRMLPTPQMRALISLYHQADSWVTPENLSQKIDEAFVPSDTNAIALSTSRVESMVSVSDLKNYITLMRQAPKMAQWDSSSSGREDRYPTSSEWSESGRNKRDLKVIEALYGVAFNHGSTNISQAFLPGFEVLLESGPSAIQDYEATIQDHEDTIQDKLTDEDLQDLLLARKALYNESLHTHE